MSRVALSRLIARQKEVASLVGGLVRAIDPDIAIEDAAGRLLLGEPRDATRERHAVSCDGQHLGWVLGDRSASAVAALLDHLAAKEIERRNLGLEVLHLYREVNLMYSFSDKLAALLDLEAVARLALQQARQLIVATDGAVLLADEATGALHIVSAFGDLFDETGGVRLDRGLVSDILQSGQAEIVNDAPADPRHLDEEDRLTSLICAPLKVGERVVGAIVLASQGPVTYVAGDLKLLTALSLQAASAIENARLFERTVQAARERERLLAIHKELEVARAKLEREMELAASIQADLFPADLPRLPGYDLAARNRPARRCGGDYYDALPRAGVEPTLLLCVADVSGKGLPASLLMSSMQATLRALLGAGPPLADLATQASGLLFATTAANKYVTAALLEFAPATGQGRYVGAGHVDSFLIGADGSAARLGSTGPPLGLMPPGLPYGDLTVQLAPGDCLALFSDGVPDAQNEAGEEFGEERLSEVLRASATLPSEAMVARVFDAIDEFVLGAPQFDDITLMLLKRA
jgi:serine phosphatase RsbU (regulator of sigma subunit)